MSTSTVAATSAVSTAFADDIADDIADLDALLAAAPVPFGRVSNYSLMWQDPTRYQQIRDQVVADQGLVPQMRYEGVFPNRRMVEVRNARTGQVIYQRKGETRFFDFTTSELYDRVIRPRVVEGRHLLFVDCYLLGRIDKPLNPEPPLAVTFGPYINEGVAIQDSSFKLNTWAQERHEAYRASAEAKAYLAKTREAQKATLEAKLAELRIEYTVARDEYNRVVDAVQGDLASGDPDRQCLADLAVEDHKAEVLAIGQRGVALAGQLKALAQEA